jgi:protein disulfide-isomerase
MKVDIWSDVRCPFCYIGKRKFEMALEKFPHKDDVKVEWHSFQLDPNLKTTTEVNAIDHISEIKGIFARAGSANAQECHKRCQRSRIGF